MSIWHKKIQRTSRLKKRRVVGRAGRTRVGMPETLEARRLLAVFVVDSAEDDGEGTLREAITLANETAGADEIRFAIPDVSGTPVISLLSALPSITEELVIDGSSQPIAGQIALDGTGAGAADGLVFEQSASGSFVTSLSIGGFVNGIRLASTDGVTVVDSVVGGDVANSAAGVLIEGGTDNLLLRVNASNNAGNGVTLDSAFDTQILGSPLDGNGVYGLEVTGGEGTIVSVSLAGDAASLSNNGKAGVLAGETIGLAVLGASLTGNGEEGIRIAGGSGVVVLGSKVSENAGVGVLIDGGDAHQIGGSGAVDGNQVTKNDSHGIVVGGGATSVTVMRNSVGTDAALVDLGNAGAGILLDGAVDAVVTFRNVVAYNDGAGISVVGGSGNRVGADETRPVGEQGQLFGNTVVSNAQGGISVEGAEGTVVSANAVGAVGVNGPVVGNSGNGILVTSSSGTVVGGPLPLLTGDPNFGNVIAGNSLNGILLDANVAVSDPDGTIVRGNTVRGNAAIGILIRNSQLQVIGGNIDDTVADIDETANTIVANAGFGISIEGGGANRIAGNFVGIDRSLNAGLGNGSAGIRILDASGNLVGGDAEAGEGNVVANNKGDGILITTVDDGAVVDSEVAFGNLVYGNMLSGNSGNGITLRAATGNAVGSSTPGEGNEIIANRGHGVALLAGADGNSVSGNLVGTNAAESTTVGNSGSGVYVNASVGNTIGGSEDGAGNLIAFNGTGVRIDAASATPATANRVVGNTIESNLAEGVRVTSSRYTFVGGAGEGEGNSIWLNGGDGVLLDGAVSQVEVIGNQIGTDAEDNQLGNKGDGIQVGVANATVLDNTVMANRIGTNVGAGLRLVNAAGTAIGGSEAADANTIVLNGAAGIVLQTGSRSNTIVGNVIRENVSGGVILDRSTQNTLTANEVTANVGAGIALIGASDNVFGGNGETDGNLIIGNAADGIALSASSNRNRIVGNLLDENDGNGVSIQSGIANEITGGNVVTRNDGAGILLAGVTRNTVIADGFVGTDATEDALGNTGHGIAFTGAISNVISNMVVANNGGNGIDISAATAAVRTAGNFVTGSTVTGNQKSGIRIAGGAGHTIGSTAAGNTISGNAVHGIHLASRTAGNAVVANVLAENNGDGILVEGGLGNLIEGGNAITLNAGDGIRLVVGAANNVISGNYIGIDADGTADLGNAGDGVDIDTGLANVVVSNVIADHTAEGARGVGISRSIARLPLQSRSQAQGKAVRGNLVQSNQLIGNYVGIGISGSAFQTVGSSTANATAPGATANTVVASFLHGIVVENGSTGTMIVGNYIGTDAAGDELVGNLGDGIKVSGSMSSRVSGNTVSFNAGHGVNFSATTSRSSGQANVLTSNTISENLGSGVRLGEASSFNTIGSVAGGNTIEANGVHGVLVEGKSNSNQIGSNTITDNGGVDELGSPIGDGVRILGSLGNVVRGGVIASNVSAGVRISDALARTTTAGNQVLAAQIFGNGGEGVRIEGGGRHIVGLARAGNTILGNGLDELEESSGAGIAIVAGADGRGSIGNIIRANSIGVDALGAASGNAGEGILVEGGSGHEISTGNNVSNNGILADAAGIRLRGVASTIIGGATAALGNVIEANAGAGVVLEELDGEGSTANVIAGNVIDDNGGDGVAVDGAASNGNTIGMQLVRTSVRGAGNVISNNAGSGVSIAAAVRNSILGNSIYGNADAITLADGANAAMPAPVILSAIPTAAGTRTRWAITGEITGAPPRQSVVVELYANPASDDPAQARTLIGRAIVRTNAEGLGTFRVVLTSTADATSTISATATSATGNTSLVALADDMLAAVFAGELWR